MTGMSVPKSTRKYTPAEYYALEEKAEYKSDYYDGEIFPCGEVGPDGQLVSMAGGSVRHSLICLNIAGEARSRLRDGPCIALESNARLKIKATGLRTYPDVSVYCGPREHDPEDPAHQTLLNPTVLFEVLSKTTEGYDRGIKASHYRRIESLKMLVFITQTSPSIEVWERQANGKWAVTDYEGMDAIVALPAIGIELPASEIYRRVDFNSEM